jgi:uncharacterized membrane protein (Fun14 family)
MSEVLPSMVFQLGVGGIGGFIAGLILKKIGRLVLLFMALVAVILYLGLKGFISVSINYDALLKAVNDFIGWASSELSWLTNFIALIPFLGSFIVGFSLGFKLG